MSENIEKSCGCIVVRDDKVLVVGARDDRGVMYWGFPKGHQEPGESEIETALRETREEVGLVVEIIDFAPIVVSHPIHNGTATKVIALFLAQVVGDDNLAVQEDEIEEARWVSFGEAEKLVENYSVGSYYLTAMKEAERRLVEREGSLSAEILR